MRKSVFHAVLIGTCITLGTLSGCGKKEEVSQAATAVREPVLATPIVGGGTEFAVIARTERCIVYRVKDPDHDRFVYWVEAPTGYAYCAGIAIP